jgi:hypothetical protein
MAIASVFRGGGVYFVGSGIASPGRGQPPALLPALWRLIAGVRDVLCHLTMSGRSTGSPVRTISITYTFYTRPLDEDSPASFLSWSNGDVGSLAAKAWRAPHEGFVAPEVEPVVAAVHGHQHSSLPLTDESPVIMVPCRRSVAFRLPAVRGVLPPGDVLPITREGGQKFAPPAAGSRGIDPSPRTGRTRRGPAHPRMQRFSTIRPSRPARWLEVYPMAASRPGSFRAAAPPTSRRTSAPTPLFEYGLDKGDAHRPGGHRESFPSSRRVMRASSSPPTVEASNSRVPRRAGLRQTRVPFCRSWQPQLSGDGPPCSVRNAYPSRQPPAASRQPPAASRHPPAASRHPPALQQENPLALCRIVLTKCENGALCRPPCQHPNS